MAGSARPQFLWGRAFRLPLPLCADRYDHRSDCGYESGGCLNETGDLFDHLGTSLLSMFTTVHHPLYTRKGWVYISFMNDERIKRINKLARQIEETETKLAELGQQRRATVAELRADGWSHQQIADALGITRSRVQQLSK